MPNAPTVFSQVIAPLFQAQFARCANDIPWQWRGRSLVVKAAEGGFNINGIENGVRLAAEHSWAGHPTYNSAMREALGAYQLLNPNMTSSQAAQILTTFANTMREHLQAAPLPIR